MDNILNNIPLKNAPINQEQKITKQIYQDYLSYKHELFDDLVNNNPNINQLTLFNKTQKLLDRFLFIFL